jgi:hypothetical protein
MSTRPDRLAWTFGGGLLLVAALTTSVPTAWAQAISYRAVCTNHGANWNEPVGDRDGHSLQVGDATCAIQGGPMDGAVATQQVLWEYDKGVGTLLSSHSVARRPGSMAVTVGRSGKLNLQMTDGRVTGWTASGTLSYVSATGSAAGLEKKNANWTSRPTGNRTYVIEIVVE